MALTPDENRRLENVENNLATLVGVVGSLADTTGILIEMVKVTQSQLQELAGKVQTVTVKLEALAGKVDAVVDIMDDWIRHGPPPPAAERPKPGSQPEPPSA